jgi:hypothetical protein
VVYAPLSAIQAGFKEDGERRRRISTVCATLQPTFAGKSLKVPCILNLRPTRELLIPIPTGATSSSTGLGSELILEIRKALYTVTTQVENHRLGGFHAFGLPAEVSHKGLEMALREPGILLRTANVSFEILPVTMPVTTERTTQDEWHEVKLYPSALDYSLIPLRKRHETLFPSVGVPFDIVAVGETFEAHVTSKKPNAASRGNYICSAGQGQIKVMYPNMGISKVPASVEFTVLSPHQAYVFRRK